MLHRIPMRILAVAGAALALPCIAAPSLSLVGTYDTGLAANGAEIVSVRESDDIAAITNVAGSIDIVDFSSPASPVLVNRITVSPSYGTPNSVAIHPRHDFVLVVAGSAGSVGRIIAYTLDGTLLHVADAGIQPDSVVIAKDGQHAVVANEAEGVTTGNAGGSGSLSLVNLTAFTGRSGRTFSVQQIALPSQTGVPGFSMGRTDDAARLAVDNSPTTLEPESVAFTSDSRFAYVTLQENSGVVRLDVDTGDLAFFGLGQTSHSADLTVNGNYTPLETLTAFRESDGIALGKDDLYFVTADEGDTRNGSGSSAPRGGRTVSLFGALTGTFIADTGNQLDDAANSIGAYPDSRSNRGGSEPEVLDLTTWRGETLVAVGLERANAVALIDVTDPLLPTVVAIRAVGAAPEGIQFMRSGSRLYVLAASEVAGTVSVLEVLP